MSRYRQKFGRWGESVAAKYLQARGYEILDRNVHNQYGEIDLVARHGEIMVFVEVKTRRSTQFGYPEASVTAKKQAHMMNAAQSYLQQHPDSDGNWRIDVIAVEARSNEPPEIVHFENAIP